MNPSPLFVFLCLIQTISATNNFVKTSGTSFVLNNNCTRITGANTYYLSYKSQYMVDKLFDDARSMGLTLIRTWGFLDIGSLDGVTRYNNDPSAYGVYFQYWDTSTNAPAYNDGDTGLQHLDYVISSAQSHGIRLIFGLTNNWQAFGGMDQYVVWGKDNGGYHDDFYTDDTIKTYYKNYISHLLNRVNTYTQITYKNDPTIFAWELTNELRCSSSQKPSSGSCTSQTLVTWVNEMGTYIKSIDSNHMVSVGDEGFFSGHGTGWLYDGTTGDFDGMVGLSVVDFGTVHVYPQDWGNLGQDWGKQWILDHVAATNKVNKPLLVEEYGWKSTDKYPVYQEWLNAIETNDIAADTFWMLASSQDGGGNYPDYDGYTLYNDGSPTSNLVMLHALRMNSSCVPSQSNTTPSSTPTTPSSTPTTPSSTPTTSPSTPTTSPSTPTTSPSTPTTSPTAPCNDIPPSSDYTCEQQASWGKCPESWMTGYCLKSCGNCPSGPGCTDLPPDTTYTCAQQVSWGKCGESWMAGYCLRSCGECTGSASSDLLASSNNSGGVGVGVIVGVVVGGVVLVVGVVVGVLLWRKKKDQERL